MAGISSIDAVKKKIQSLQQVADEAEEHAEHLQREANAERQAQERVRLLGLGTPGTPTLQGGLDGCQPLRARHQEAEHCMPSWVLAALVRAWAADPQLPHGMPGWDPAPASSLPLGQRAGGAWHS